MLRPVSALALALTLSACGALAGARQASEDRAFANAYRATFRESELCASSFKYDWWCPVAQYPGGGLTLPTETTSYLGISAFVGKDQAAHDAFLEQTSLSVLHLGPKGGAVAIMESEDGAEREVWVRAYLSAIRALKGRTERVLLDDELARSVETDREARALNPLVLTTLEGRWTGTFPARIWESEGEPWGEAYVVLEEGANGVLISVFPRVAQVVLPMGEGDHFEEHEVKIARGALGRRLEGASRITRTRSQTPAARNLVQAQGKHSPAPHGATKASGGGKKGGTAGKGGKSGGAKKR